MISNSAMDIPDTALINILLEHELPLLAECRIEAHAITCYVKNSTYVIPIQTSIPSAMNELRRTLEAAFDDAIRFKHCMDCVYWKCSRMSQEMSKGIVGKCEFHNSMTHPFYCCEEYLNFSEFRPSGIPPAPQPYAGTVDDFVAKHLRPTSTTTVYPYGTIVIGLSSAKPSKAFCDSRIKSVIQFPERLSVVKVSHDVQKIGFCRDDTVLAVVFANDRDSWRHSVDEVALSRFLKSNAARHLGIDQLADMDKSAAIISLLRLWSDGVSISFGRRDTSPPHDYFDDGGDTYDENSA